MNTNITFVLVAVAIAALVPDILAKKRGSRNVPLTIDEVLQDHAPNVRQLNSKELNSQKELLRKYKKPKLISIVKAWVADHPDKREKFFFFEVKNDKGQHCQVISQRGKITVQDCMSERKYNAALERLIVENPRDFEAVLLASDRFALARDNKIQSIESKRGI